MSERSRISSIFKVSLSFQKFFTGKACLAKEMMATLDGVPRPVGRPLTAPLRSATRWTTSAGCSTPCLASAAMRSRSWCARMMHGCCSAEQRASQLTWHAWKWMEGRSVERRTAGRGVGGLCRKHGRVSDGRCDCDVLACTCVAGTQRTSLPDTQNLVEVWVGASRPRISLVVCTVDLLLTPTNAYRVPSIITRLGTSVTRVASRKSGYVRF